MNRIVQSAKKQDILKQRKKKYRCSNRDGGEQMLPNSEKMIKYNCGSQNDKETNHLLKFHFLVDPNKSWLDNI